jgi:hypothetical protein
LVPTSRENWSLIDFQIITKDKEISKILLDFEEIFKLVEQYKTLILKKNISPHTRLS